MTAVLVVEDDDAIRNNVARILRLEGYDVSVATNGIEGLERAQAVRPGVVISDIQHAGHGRLRAGGKRGRITLSIESAVQSREDQLRRAFAESIAGNPPAQRPGLDAPVGAITDQVLPATVLFSDIRNFTSLAEKLDSSEVAELLMRYFEHTSEPVLRHGGMHLKFIGDGLMAVFAGTPGGPPTPPARRAVSRRSGTRSTPPPACSRRARNLGGRWSRVRPSCWRPGTGCRPAR